MAVLKFFVGLSYLLQKIPIYRSTKNGISNRAASSLLRLTGLVMMLHIFY